MRILVDERANECWCCLNDGLMIEGVGRWEGWWKTGW